MTPHENSMEVASSTGADHNGVTIALGKIEHQEHMEEMEPAISWCKAQPLIVKAYAVDDPNAPPIEKSNVKHVHFVRHGQGFHNLMADIAKAEGRTWVQVSKK
jgi:hypothetical protein